MKDTKLISTLIISILTLIVFTVLLIVNLQNIGYDSYTYYMLIVVSIGLTLWYLYVLYHEVKKMKQAIEKLEAIIND